jgi:TatD DNase family protein
MAQDLPPIDAHAHVKTAIEERELRALRATLFAVTREASEWDRASQRRDQSCIWGLGCHPQVASAFDSFDQDRLHRLLERCPLIGEVGLDRRSKVPMKRQLEVFRSVLEVAAARSRIMTIHSAGAAEEVLAELAARPIAGAILHWWRGDPRQTQDAIELGCYFSINGAEVRTPRVMASLPRDRVLTETDYPHTKRIDRKANRPGSVVTTEAALAEMWGEDVGSVREQLWANLTRLCVMTRTSALLPRSVQATMLSLRRTA